jgi:hypothetical protein
VGLLAKFIRHRTTASGQLTFGFHNLNTAPHDFSFDTVYP